MSSPEGLFYDGICWNEAASTDGNSFAPVQGRKQAAAKASMPPGAAESYGQVMPQASPSPFPRG